jgi:hypothetical protein
MSGVHQKNGNTMRMPCAKDVREMTVLDVTYSQEWNAMSS